MKKFFTIFVVAIVAISTVTSFFAGGSVRRRAQTDNQPSPEAEDVNQQVPVTPTEETIKNLDTTSGASEIKAVSYTKDGFKPETITVPLGTPIAFTNQTEDKMWVASNPHPAHTTLKEFDADRGFGTGESYTFTFTTPGTWKYHDHLNPSRGGIVIVR